MIKIENLSCFFEEQNVFSNLNLVVEKGDYLIITGKNGSGKSTLLKTILGINKNFTGNITIDDLSVKEILQKKKIGYVPQLEYRKFSVSLLIEEYLSLYAKKEKINKILKELNYEYLKEKSINEISGGETQIVNIIKALLNNPEYLILDEPNVGLDFRARKKIYNLLSKINKLGITIILITHYVDEIDCKATKIFYIEEQKLELVNKDGCIYC